MPVFRKTRSWKSWVGVGFSGSRRRFVGRICDFHMKGTCVAGDLCRFAHKARVIKIDEKEAKLVRGKPGQKHIILFCSILFHSIPFYSCSCKVFNEPRLVAYVPQR